ncbi:unnamed protein product [Strongylus vulgaris]|uniref:Uncharacterized protein n=1 Tax=Strongylus vulgaris TaxID=40348 RepID=A0A3P7J1E8_STRVU|nr:unnamed protein product [Strongylus vulgaris]
MMLEAMTLIFHILDAEVIEVPCVEKGDEIRSYAEFVEFTIEIPQQIKESMPEKTVKTREDTNVSANETVHFEVPTTLRQFSLDYRELENLPPENFAKYFLVSFNSNCG